MPALGNDHLTGGQKSGRLLLRQWRPVLRRRQRRRPGPAGRQLDQLGLQGNYAGASAITFGADQISGIEMIVLLTAPTPASAVAAAGSAMI